MKKIILLIVFICLAIGVKSQGRFSYSYSDFVAGKCEPIDTCLLIMKGDVYGITKYKSENKELDKKLKKARIIEYRDSLYVNCRGLIYHKMNEDHTWAEYEFRRRFVPAFRIDDRFYFVCLRRETQLMGIGLVFGAVGSLVEAGINISTKKKMKNYGCYVLNSDKPEAQYVTKEYIMGLLAKDDQLREAYKKESEPDFVGTILKYLHLYKEKNSSDGKSS